MPWSKAALLRHLRKAYRKDVSTAEIRELERLARQYGVTRKEIAQAKDLARRNKRGPR